MFNIEYDVIDEVTIGDTKLRLVEDHVRKSRKIQIWSSLSKQWHIMHRHNIETMWSQWKQTAIAIKSRKVK